MLAFKEWPTDPARLARYRDFERLYKGEHHKVFAARVNRDLAVAGRDGLTFLEIDYPRTIVNVVAELLVGHSPIIAFESPEDQAAWVDVADRSDFDTALLEAAQDAGYRGDAVFVIRQTEDGPLIETKPAYSYFPECNPDNVRDVLSHQLAWQREFEDRPVLRVDRYLPGEIHQEAYLLNASGKVIRPIIGAELYRLLRGSDPVIPSGIADEIPLVHFANERSSNEFWGRSDLGGGLPTLLEEIDVRASTVSRVLDKHSDPKLAGPPLATGPDGRIIGAEMGYIQIEPGDEAPRYLVYDAQLIAAFKQYDLLKDEIFRHAQICPILTGLVPGARYDSGRALRALAAPTLSKLNRKGQYLAPALRRVARMAVAMKREVPLSTVPSPLVQWRDGLPKDLSEMAQTNSIRISAGTLSRRTATMLEMECDAATADVEQAQIRLEKEEFGALEPVPAITNTPETSVPVEGEGSEEVAA